MGEKGHNIQVEGGWARQLGGGNFFERQEDENCQAFLSSDGEKQKERRRERILLEAALLQGKGSTFQSVITIQEENRESRQG